MRFLAFILFSSFIICSCRKDDCEYLKIQTASYDTIFPHAYFPAYPGSWWEYNSSVRIETDDEWQVFNYRQYLGGNCGAYTLDLILLPSVIDQKERFLFNDRYISQNEYCFKNHSVDILFNSETDNWESWYDPNKCYHVKGGHTDLLRYKYRRNVGELDNMTINGTLFNDIMVIEERNLYSGHLDATRTYYYAKNVGIIREIYVPANPADSVNVDTLDITSYYIAN